MKPFTTLAAVAAPLDMTNVDTDRLIPARFLGKPREQGLAQYAFHDMRFHADGSENPGFVLNQEPYRASEILVGDSNFGCGSSREAAVYVLADLGIRAIIAPSFGDIFYNNCSKNGVLPVRLSVDEAAHIRAWLHQHPGSRISIDLPAQKVVGPDGTEYGFEIDPFRKASLVTGLDDIDLTLQYEAELAAFEQRRRAEVPWSLPARQA
jgi:3-isopropylmalate/(R)-2-methylmalate dehydratase small subunit